MNDPIVDEVRRVRDEHAARFNYDLDAIFRDIKQQEKRSGHVFVDGVTRRDVASPVVPANGASPDAADTAARQSTPDVDA